MGAELQVSENAMSKRWYIVHTYSGHEAKAKQSLLERAKTFGREAEFDEVLIPEENEKDLPEIPKNIKKDLEIVSVRWIDDVAELALERVPSAPAKTAKPKTAKPKGGAQNDNPVVTTH